MAKIARYNGDLAAFASSAVGVERTVFGDVIQSNLLNDNINADFLRGWGIISASSPPSKQDFNALGYTVSFLIAYLHQMGVAEWNIAQEYHLGSATIRTGNLYVSKINSNTGNDPASDSVSWKVMAATEDVDDAIEIAYDNVASGLSATEVQSAIDELRNANKIIYNPAASGLAAVNVQTAVDEVVASTGMVGAVQFFAMSSTPFGWLSANGAAVSRAVYAALFAAIGTTYGIGDGATTFNIPDLRGEFIRAWDNGRGVDTGRAIATSQADAMEQHSHYSGLALQSGEAGGYAAAGYTANNLASTVRAINASSSPSINGISSGVVDTGTAITSAKLGATSSCKSPSTETRSRNIAMHACIKY